MHSPSLEDTSATYTRCVTCAQVSATMLALVYLLDPTTHLGGSLVADGTAVFPASPPQISVHEIDQSNDDFVILASDGLWDHVTNLEAVEIVRKAAYSDKHPESASDCLVQVRAAWFGRRH